MGQPWYTYEFRLVARACQGFVAILSLVGGGGGSHKESEYKITGNERVLTTTNNLHLKGTMPWDGSLAFYVL